MVEIFDNIRKIYRFSKPCEELFDYIEFFSESSDSDTFRYFISEPFTVKMFASWTPTIWINMGTPYMLDVGNNRYSISNKKDILVLRNGTVTRNNLPGDHIFTIKFFPGALKTIFGIDQSYLINQVEEAGCIIPALLIEKIKSSCSFEERIKLIQEFLLIKLSVKKQSDHYQKLVCDSIDLYTRSGMSYNTSRLAEKLFITSKTINRYFHHTIGISPKKYFSILRARAALTAFISDKRTFDPCEHGYYDMSHFYREALQFTGQRMVNQ